MSEPLRFVCYDLERMRAKPPPLNGAAYIRVGHPNQLRPIRPKWVRWLKSTWLGCCDFLYGAIVGYSCVALVEDAKLVVKVYWPSVKTFLMSLF